MISNMRIPPNLKEVIVASILWEVRSRILVEGRFKNLSNHISLVHRWNLHMMLPSSGVGTD